MGYLGDPVKVPLPHISGSDVSGIVEETGGGCFEIEEGG